MYVFSRSMKLLLLLAVIAGLAESRRRPLFRAPRSAELTGEYLIVAEESQSPEEFRQLLARISRLADSGTVRSYVENVGKVITASLSPYAIELVRQLDGVDHIEEEDEARGDSMLQGWPIPWHLDRLDEELGQNRSLDRYYQPIGTGKGVDVYILDSGIRYEHSEFEFRAKYAGYDPYDQFAQRKAHNSSPMQGRDCHGHGTHVASLCGGIMFGTAKKVTLYSVRVLGCQNSAPWSVVLDGLDFVSRIIQSRMRPAVITMSLSGSYHQSVNNAVRELHRKNIPVVTVAGNEETDCCNYSPASSPHAITVAGTRLGDGLYRIGRGTNYGSCVDLFAPAEQITGASHLCWNCTKILSGTSMAAPMVAGIVAIHLSRTPRISAQQVKERIVNDSLHDVIDYQGMPRRYQSLTPNHLVQIAGSCGGSWFPLSQSTFHTPMFPDRYPGNLNCEWSISADEGQQVQVQFHTVVTERNFDQIQVIDGSCWDKSKLMATISGDLGTVNVTFRSLSPSLCVRFTSDGVTHLSGFNATYTKLYSNTSLRVVAPPLLSSRPFSTVLLAHLDTKNVNNDTQLQEYATNGFRPTWCVTYGSGPKSSVDIILTNDTRVRSQCQLEVGNKSLARVLERKAAEGYYLWHVSTRTRGKSVVRPSFYLLLKPLPPHLEHVYYLRENESEYLRHLETHTEQNYTLLSHSFYYVDGQLYASSAYVRDRRLALKIPILRSPPARWRSYYNVSLGDFPYLLSLHKNQSFYPTSINTYFDAANSSRFSLVFEEKPAELGFLMECGLSEASAADMLDSNRAWYKPFLSLGYYDGDEQKFFLQLQKKRSYEL